MPQFITVKSVDNRCGLWEVNADHPGGEVFVREQPTKVARTPAVSKALNNGRLLLVDDNEPTGDDNEPTGDDKEPTKSGSVAINATAKAIELAAELGVDLAMVTGTLDNGRIGVDDVKDAAGG
jgi:pyruvate/2-oxoglutarate dehydrogenase complex dihydrolipoamide acyltransferase (E2) component